MTKPTKKPYRKRHLFARSVGDVVNLATKPLMSKQGKLYSACLRDWAQIVGPERAAVTRPQRLQFPTHGDASGATLHIEARASAAPELAYVTEQMLEQCARYFGYRAVTRIVIHATHEGFADAELSTRKSTAATTPKAALSKDVPSDMRGVLERLSAHVTSASDKKN